MKKNIAIIGGGYTGLTAAYELSKKGFGVTVFEAGKDLGGLAGGFKIEGEKIEKVYHHIFKTDTDIINLTKELGIEERLKWHDSSVAIYYDKNIYPFMTPIDLLRFTPLSFLNRIRAGAVAFYLQKYNKGENLLSKTAFEWMYRWAGRSVSKVIWEPLLRGKFDNYFDKVSMAWLWARIHTRANSKEKGEIKEKLGYYDGGFDVFTDVLRDKILEFGGDIRINSKIQKAGIENDKNFLVINSKKEYFDSVLATVPSNVFGDICGESLNKENLIKLSSIDYIGAVCLVFSSEQDLSKYYWHNINDTSFPFLVFINHTKLVDKKRYNNKNIYYIGTYVNHNHRYFNEKDKEIIREWYGSLKKIFPDFDEKKVNEEHLFKFKHAQHIVDCDYKAKIPDYKTPIKGVYLANFSQIFPEDRGTNFAVREGIKMAELIFQKYRSEDGVDGSF